MKPLYAIAAAAIVLCSPAHAELYTFEYTAIVSRIGALPDGFSDNGGVSVPSASIPAGSISIGDKVTGTISYDSQLVDTDVSGYVPSFEQTVNFASAPVNFFSNGYKYGYMQTYPVGSTEKDSLSMGTYRYLYLPTGAMTREEAGFTFADSTHTKFDGNKVPGANASTFDSNTMRYVYSDNSLNTGFAVDANITNLRLVSAVPEPGTYAMLLAGLGVLSWRRRKALQA